VNAVVKVAEKAVVKVVVNAAVMDVIVVMAAIVVNEAVGKKIAVKLG